MLNRVVKIYGKRTKRNIVEYYVQFDREEDDFAWVREENLRSYADLIASYENPPPEPLIRIPGE